MDCSTPGFPVLHHLPELAQIHIHWVNDAIHYLVSVSPFSSRLHSFPALGSFPMNGIFASGSWSIRASASVLSMNIQDWFPLGLTGLISLLSRDSPRVFTNTTVQKHQFFGTQLSSQSNSHIHTTTGKTLALTRWTFVGKVISLLFNMLSRLVITFLPRSKRLLISWLQSPSTVILEALKVKSATASTVSPSIWHEVERVTGKKARCLLMEEIACKCQTFLSLLS